MKLIGKYHKRIRKYVKRNPARSAGYFSTFTLIMNHMGNIQSLPLLMFLASLIIGIGESAQRAEDKKSIAAIYIKNKPTTPDNVLIDQLIEASEKKIK
jgi:hypothetical protein